MMADGGAVGHVVCIPAFTLLLTGVALITGCADSGNSITTGSTALLSAGPATAATSADSVARSVEVASTAACAQKWGLSFDPVRLRTEYLAYEAKQGAAGAQLANIERSYDATLRDVTAHGRGSSAHCSGKNGEQIKADLQRYRAGYFAPRANVVAPDEPFDTKKFWKEQDDG